MARTSRSMLSASRLLAGTSVLLGFLALLPTPAIRWVAELSEPVTILLGPLNSILKGGVQVISGGSETAGKETPELVEMRRQMDEYRFQWLNVREENERLRKQITELQK